MNHEHPLKILRYTVKNLWLLIFPLLRSAHIFSISPRAVTAWLKGAWFDLLICALILLYGAMRWYFCQFTYDNNAIRYQSGILIKQKTEIPCRCITSATEEYTFYLRPFQALRLRIHTGAEDIAGTDVQLLISKNDLTAIRSVIPILKNTPTDADRHHPQMSRLLFFSFLFSSSLSGALYAAIVFLQGGKISRDILNELQVQELLSTLTDQVVRYFHGIPRMAVNIAIIILGLWLLSFLKNLLSYSKFRFYADASTFSVYCGLFTKLRYQLRRGAVNYIDIRQNLMMKLLRLMSVHISCPGYGSGQNALPVLLPLLKQKQAEELLTPLLPASCLSEPFPLSQKPPKSHRPLFGIWLYLWQPLLLIGLLLLGILGTARFFPEIYRRFIFLDYFLLLPAVWYLVIQAISATTTKMWFTSHQICLHYSHGLAFHTVLAPKQYLVSLRVIRTKMGKRCGICHVHLYFQGKHPHCHRLRAIPEASLQAFLDSMQIQP